MRQSTVILSILTTSCLSFAATAQDEPATPPAGAPAWIPRGYPDAYTHRPLTVPPGMFQITLPVVLNFSKGEVLKPVWIPLDMRFGMADRFELFISHNALGKPLAVGQGGPCLGKVQSCPKSYNNLNIGGQYSLARIGPVELSGFLAAEFKQFSPDTLFAIDVGVGVKYVASIFSVKATPRFGVGAYKRGPGNEEGVGVPIQIALQASPRLAPFIDTGIFGMFGSSNRFSDTYEVPLGVGVDFLATHGFDVGAEFMFPTLGHGSTIAGKATDSRTLMLYMAWRFQ